MEDGPKLNKGAAVSLLIGLVATLMLLYTFFGPRPSFALCLPSVAFGTIALGTGVAAMSQIRGSEGSERGYVIAGLGIALGAIPTLLAIVAFIDCFSRAGGCF